jgi:hypothetical protein
MLDNCVLPAGAGQRAHYETLGSADLGTPAPKGRCINVFRTLGRTALVAHLPAHFRSFNELRLPCIANSPPWPTEWCR